MWPNETEMPIEDYEYALTGGESPPVRRPPWRARLSPEVLASMLAGAFLLGALAGWRVAEMFED
jgi:hypothetical protein